MALIPHPCYNPNEFRFDTDTSQVALHLDPSGYLSSGPAGVRVNMPSIPAQIPANHMYWDEHDFVLTGPINTGILDIGANGPVTPVLVGPSITNGFPRAAMVEFGSSFNGVILGPGTGFASAALLASSVSVDAGVTWHRSTTVGMMTPDSDARAGYYTQQDLVRYALNPGQTITPQWILSYEAVFNYSDYVQASFLRTRIRLHTI